MVAIPYWYDQPDAWDTCVLGGNALPGIAKVKLSKGKKLDVKQSPGTHGATITDQGYKPASVTVSLQFWTSDHWNSVQAILPTLEPPPGKSNATPFDIMHPVAAIRNVKSVLIEDIDGPEETSTRGLYQIVFKCVQFFPSSTNMGSATNTPKTSIPAYSNSLSQPALPAPPGLATP